MSIKAPIDALSIPARQKKSNYPAPFAKRVEGREKRALGDAFGLKNFGVNLTRLAPNAESALLHRHSVQDEMVYILSGEPTLITEEGSYRMKPGMCAGFPAKGTAHHLVNQTNQDVLYLEIGDRLPNDTGEYPEDDLVAKQDDKGQWVFTRKDGAAYSEDDAS